MFLCDPPGLLASNPNVSFHLPFVPPNLYRAQSWATVPSLHGFEPMSCVSVCPLHPLSLSIHAIYRSSTPPPIHPSRSVAGCARLCLSPLCPQVCPCPLLGNLTRSCGWYSLLLQTERTPFCSASTEGRLSVNPQPAPRPDPGLLVSTDNETSRRLEERKKTQGLLTFSCPVWP